MVTVKGILKMKKSGALASLLFNCPTCGELGSLGPVSEDLTIGDAVPIRHSSCDSTEFKVEVSKITAGK